MNARRTTTSRRQTAHYLERKELFRYKNGSQTYQNELPEGKESSGA